MAGQQLCQLCVKLGGRRWERAMGNEPDVRPTVLVVAGASLIRIDHPVGRSLFLVSGVLSLYWWTLYRRLAQ